jgi:hypothetical protein
MVGEVRDEGKEAIHPVAVIAPPVKGAERHGYNDAQGILADAKIESVPLQDVGALARKAQRNLDLTLT